MNKIMKFQIIKAIDSDWKEFGSILNKLRNDTRELMNKCIQLCWEYYGYSSEYKGKNGFYPNISDVINYKKIDGYCYDKLKLIYNKFNTGNYTTSITKACNRWKNDLKEVLKGEKSIASFKKDIPIDLHNKSIQLMQEEGNYYLNLSLVSLTYKKELNKKSGQFLVLIKVKDNTQKTILQRILNGEYKIAASQLIQHKGKWFINLCYGFELEQKSLNKENVMGIDMGKIYPIYMAFNNSLNRYKIEGGEIERFRKQTEKRKNELYTQGKYCGEGRIGHGIKTRIKPIEIMRDKISNFRQLTNHKYSKYVVSMAVKNNCGVIQMEDLSGISTDNNFLKDWPYYDLQQKISYKAEEIGIMIKKIIPDYTSQRCNKCGYIHTDNRQTQASFKCLECGYETNADYNAASNISLLDIEEIIYKQLIKQEMFEQAERYEKKLSESKL